MCVCVCVCVVQVVRIIKPLRRIVKVVDIMAADVPEREMPLAQCTRTTHLQQNTSAYEKCEFLENNKAKRDFCSRNNVITIATILWVP